MNKAVAGTVLGVGMAAMAITGAGAASADPISDSVKSVTDSVNHTVDGVTDSVNHTVDGVKGSFNKTVSTVANGVNGNKFVSNLGSGGNILTVSKNLHDAVQVWTKVGNGR
jgi:MoaA/NifB/PqqE/SkfB family radical SAM enzyme